MGVWQYTVASAHRWSHVAFRDTTALTVRVSYSSVHKLIHAYYNCVAVAQLLL